MHSRFAFGVVFSMACAGLSHAEEIQGAKLAIAAATRIDGEAPANPQSLAAMLDAFLKGAEGMSTEEAVAGWLKLLDFRLKIEGYVRADPFVALPPVEAWDTLAAELDRRAEGKADTRSRGQWLLAALLRGNDAELRTRVETLRKAWADNNNLLGNLETFATARWPADGASELEEFRKTLELSGRYLNVPDLTVIPRPEAEDLLLLAIPKAAQLKFANPETRKIALEVLEKNPDHFKSIPWPLFSSPEDGPLIEARLPDDYVLARDDHAARQGLGYYFSHLVAKRDFEKADKIRKLYQRNDAYYLMSGARGTMEETARKNMRDYLLRVLRENPSQPFWMELSRLATPGDGEIWDFLREALDQDRITGAEDRKHARSEWLEHLFEQGGEADAMRYLQKFIDNSTGEELQALLFKQALAARLLGDQATVDKATEKLEEVVSRTSVGHEFVALEMERGRFAQLEKIAVEWMRNSKFDTWSSGEDAAVLTRIYDAAGRPDDVLAMLDGWPRWGDSDLSGIIAGGSSDIGLFAARALAVKGRKDEAVEILKEVIKSRPDEDAAYAEFLKLAPADCESVLKDFAVKFPFEERPMIWLAQWYADANRLAEGETTIRKAISIDPSDGDTGKGDRMRAYRVLGEIQRKQGKTGEAEFMANVDKAIRLSEDADDWWQAGMTRWAMAMYDEALGIFGDAYCIQSRLVLRYDSMGDSANALKHYQRAFELMPDSFGRIESHCFGCEGAFSSAAAQRVADVVFTALAAEPDAKPQVFYLLGYLRDSQGRYKDAADLFRKAVEKDPDYVNALAKLAEREDENGLTREERDRIAVRLVALSDDMDPGNIHDLRLMWQAALEKDRQSAWRTPKEPLYPLVAAAAEEKAKAEARSKSQGESDVFSSWDSTRTSSRRSITHHSLIQPIQQMLVAEE